MQRRFAPPSLRNYSQMLCIPKDSWGFPGIPKNSQEFLGILKESLGFLRFPSDSWWFPGIPEEEPKGTPFHHLGILRACPGHPQGIPGIPKHLKGIPRAQGFSRMPMDALWLPRMPKYLKFDRLGRTNKHTNTHRNEYVEACASHSGAGLKIHGCCIHYE